MMIRNMRLITLMAFCVIAVTALSKPSLLFARRASEGANDFGLTHETSARCETGEEGRDPDAIWREIKSLAEKEASESASATRTGLSVLLVGSTPQLTIKKGDVGDLGFGDDPYGIPFRYQLQIEYLRRSLTTAQLNQFAKTIVAAQQKDSPKPSPNRTSAQNSNDPWECYLDQAELLVRQTVLAIEAINDKQRLKAYLQKTGDEIDALLYNKFFESIEQYAQENGINVIYDRGGPRPVQVPINTEPSGATVWIMTQLRYQQQVRILKTDPSRWPWQELVQNPTEFVANSRYRYQARWPDGRKAEGDIVIKDASPVTFRPQ